MKNKFNNLRVFDLFLNEPKVEKHILNRAKKRKQIIYGAQSIKKQIGIFSRDTKDYDIFSNNPKKEAMRTEKELDRIAGFNYYYSKPAMHPGTHKVMNKGYDLKKGTNDDEGIVDYSNIPKPTPKIKFINGIRYRKLSEEERAKMKAVKDPEFKFRHAKDRDDLGRIRFAKHKINLLKGGIYA